MAKRKTNPFESASRLKLRIQTNIGTLSVEDLWDLPLISKTGQVNLDDLARTFNRELRAQAEESFVEKTGAQNPTDELIFDIILRVIEVRLEDAEAAKLAKKKAELRQKIADIIADKEDEALASQSLEELQAQLADL